MPVFVDARLPVRFGPIDAVGPESALLIEGDAPAPPGVPVARFVLAASSYPPGHPPGCACCAPRGPAAEALGRLFLDRARGGRLFRDVVAVTRGPAGKAAVRAALAQDLLAAARFRLSG